MTDTLRLREGSVEWREIDGELVGLQTATSTYFSVNATGTILWRRLADGTTRAGLVAALRERFALPQATAERDVERFLEAVRACGLLAA